MLRASAVAALFLQALQTGEDAIADHGLFLANGFQFFVLLLVPLHKLEAPEDYSANHAEGRQESRQFD